MTTKQIITTLEKRKKALAKERDRLRALMDDIEQYEERASDAVESIEYAIDRLSELV